MTQNHVTKYSCCVEMKWVWHQFVNCATGAFSVMVIIQNKSSCGFSRFGVQEHCIHACNAFIKQDHSCWPTLAERLQYCIANINVQVNAVHRQESALTVISASLCYPDWHVRAIHLLYVQCTNHKPTTRCLDNKADILWILWEISRMNGNCTASDEVGTLMYYLRWNLCARNIHETFL